MPNGEKYGGAYATNNKKGDDKVSYIQAIRNRVQPVGSIHRYHPEGNPFRGLYESVW